jgi:hypothetical protein
VRLFALLSEHRDDVGRQRVVNLEWQLFPIVGLDADAPTLHRAIVEDPAFFAELVVHCFKPATSPEPEEGEAPAEVERKRAVATRAYEVLRSCRRCPGVTRDGQVDIASLRSWISDARAGLQALDRATIGDLQIGELLAHSPAGADGSPLHEAVRDVLEEIRSDDVERGIEVGIYNARGMTSRGVMDAGTKEWELAKTHLGHSEAARDWPRTRKVLKRIAESYEADARGHDAEAERRRQGLGW